MSEIKAGVVVVTEFCKSESGVFSGYIEYIDRDEAVRNAHLQDYNVYQDYMGNPYKTTGLFTDEKNCLSMDEKAQLKDTFKMAQGNGSLMWQTVISFDNQWLKENGLWNGYLDAQSERKIREVVRKSMDRMLEKEGLQNAVWSAAIHLNTDNVHVHVATVEPVPMREKRLYTCYKEYKEYEKDGKKQKMPVSSQMEYKGKFKMSSIEACRRVVVNEIINQREMNLRINRVIRESIVQKKREMLLQEDKELREKFLELHRKILKVSKKQWHYNSKAMTGFKLEIDKLSRFYLEKYHKSDFEQLKQDLKKQDELYRKAYGKSDNSYMEGKIEDLYTRLGNAVLKELKEYDNKMEKLEQNEVEGNGPEQDEGEPEVRFERRKSEGKSVENQNSVEEEKPETGICRKWFKGIEEARKYIYTFEEKQNFEVAKKLLEAESEKGNALADFELGKLYENGKGIMKNRQTAQEYYQRALRGFLALDGKERDRNINYRIGLSYLQGKGTGIDREKAQEYLKASAEQGHKYAAIRLGKLYLEDEDHKDVKEAVKWYERASDMGSSYADYCLGKIYHREKEVQDREKAVKYFEKSMENGNFYAATQLGNMYTEKEYRDDAKAERYYERAEKMGDSQAGIKLQRVRQLREWERRRVVRRTAIHTQKAVGGLKRALNNEYESYKNQREYERVMEEQRREQRKRQGQEVKP